MSNNSLFEWVEILEPSSRKRMFANIATGDCLWELTPGIPFKPCHDDQWWELYDSGSTKHYYYNVATQQTVWDRPTSGDVVALSKLQSMQEQIQRSGGDPDDQDPEESLPAGAPFDPPARSSHAYDADGTADGTADGIPPSPPGHEPDAMPPSTPPPPPPEMMDGLDGLDAAAYPEPTDLSAPFPAAPQAHAQSTLAPPTLSRSPSQTSAKSPAHASTAPMPRPAPAPAPLDRSPAVSRPAPLPPASAPLPHHGPPPAPPLPMHRPAPGPPGAAGESKDLTEYRENLATHKKGLFRKKVSIATMLSWTKEAITKPMLLTHPRRVRKDAVDLFRTIQVFMGDRPGRGREPAQGALEIVSKCWDVSNGTSLRDEIFIQLCKQTSSNKNTASCEQGWLLLFICLNFFPPSNKFFSYLQGYISRNTSGQPGVVCSYAESCLKKLERVQQAGAKRGSQQPTLAEIEHARQSILHPPVFGSPLEDVMEAQQETQPGARIPVVLKSLTSAILESRGAQTEGIFRVPGDIDAVNALRLNLNQGNLISSFVDPHVPGSALKLWFRELPSPIIGADLYDSCISHSDSAASAIAVIGQMPELNHNVLMFIVHFLQIIGRPENQRITKMSYDNLAMVWAPNFLRCPSEDPMVIFNNTRKEMAFVRLLLLNWDTSAAASL